MSKLHDVIVTRPSRESQNLAFTVLWAWNGSASACAGFGMLYHVVAQGNNDQKIFSFPKDYQPIVE
jgi:hypothetical protein